LASWAGGHSSFKTGGFERSNPPRLRTFGDCALARLGYGELGTLAEAL
jgi:hypothetical protein